jgi:hypothetical protein
MDRRLLEILEPRLSIFRIVAKIDIVFINAKVCSFKEARKLEQFMLGVFQSCPLVSLLSNNTCSLFLDLLTLGNSNVYITLWPGQ